MTDSVELIETMVAQKLRREGRRAFFKAAVGAAAFSTAGFGFASAADAQVVTDNDVLNFALNLEYLEANFYYYAAYGVPIPAASITAGGPGTGIAVPADTAANAAGVLYNAGARAVKFSDPVIQQYAIEIAQDELAHVNFLRTALGSARVAQPVLDVGITPTGAFSSAARSAGLIGATTTAAPTFFDPYANDVNFLYGAFVFEDVGVTAYKGASPLLTVPAYIDAAAGILATEAYHASIVRTSLDQLGIATPTIRTDIDKISDARDSLDGTSDLDQGISRATGQFGLTSNIVPTDANGIAFSRSGAQVLNVVYLSKTAVSAGGFFPNGVNGNIKTSAAN